MIQITVIKEKDFVEQEFKMYLLEGLIGSIIDFEDYLEVEYNGERFKATKESEADLLDALDGAIEFKPDFEIDDK